MVSVGLATGSPAQALAAVSIPTDALVVGFAMSEYSAVGSLAIAYAYKV